MIVVTNSLCAVDSCGRDAFCRGWCRPHYMRWWKHGDVRADRPIGGRTATEAWCPSCERLLPLAAFHRRSTGTRGVGSFCRDCLRTKFQTTYRESFRAYQRQWREANPGKIAEYGRRWTEANPDKVRDKKRRQVEADPLRARRYARTSEHNRRARESVAVGHASSEQVQARWDYYGGRCWLCGAPAAVMDHVKPLAAGGAGWPANLRPACARCNQRKRARWPFDVEEFRARRAA